MAWYENLFLYVSRRRLMFVFPCYHCVVGHVAIDTGVDFVIKKWPLGWYNYTYYRWAIAIAIVSTYSWAVGLLCRWVKQRWVQTHWALSGAALATRGTPCSGPACRPPSQTLKWARRASSNSLLGRRRLSQVDFKIILYALFQLICVCVYVCFTSVCDRAIGSTVLFY